MAGIIVHKKIPPDIMRADAKQTIEKIEEWFEQNPKRRVCQADLWYDRRISIKRKTVAEQVNRLADVLIAEY